MPRKKDEINTTVEVAEVEAAEKESVKEPVKEPAKKVGRPVGKKNTVKADKQAPKIEMIVEYQDKKAEVTKIEERVKAQFVAEGHRAGNIKTLNIYVKPEDGAAYYVINEKFSGRVDLF